MYTLLYSALKNMGDFLIYERIKELLRRHKGMQDYVEIHGRRESLGTHLDRVNATKAVIICSGLYIAHRERLRRAAVLRAAMAAA